MDPSVKRVLFETLRPLMFSFTYHIDGNVLEKAMEKKEKKIKPITYTRAHT